MPSSSTRLRRAAVAGILVLVALSVAAGGPPTDTIWLRSGERLMGKIVADDPDRIVIDSQALGRIEIPRDQIERVEQAEEAAAEIPPGPPGQTNAAAKPPPQDYVRIYNDHGLRYEVIQPIHVKDPFFGRTNLVSEQAQVRGSFGLKGAFDAAAFANGDGEQKVDSGLEVRTLRFYTTGEFGITRTNQFKLELGVSDQNFYIHDAYLRWPGLPYLGNLTFGYVAAPQTLQNLEAFGNLTFMEAASPVQAFGPGNRMAVQLNQGYFSNRITATLGFYSVGQGANLNFGDASESLARPILRLTALPIYQPDASVPRLLHIGASFSFVFSDSAQIQYRAKPESDIAPVLVDTGPIAARQAFVFGGESAYLLGPLSLSGEAMGSVVLPDTGGNLTFWGAYGELGWFLTGEQRSYDKTTGVPGILLPHAPLSLKNHGLGAWELATRFSYLDLTDGPIDGGRMAILMPGLNWYWNQHLRWQFNYGFSHVDGGPSPGNLNIFQARVQFAY